MSSSFQAFGGALLVSLVLGAPRVGAQPDERRAPTELRESGPPDATRDAATARALFEEGLAHVRDEKWELAADRFRRVVAIRPSHVAAYNLASALSRLGSVVESREILHELLDDATVPEETRGASRELLAEVEPRIASITVRVPGDTTGHELLLDGELLGEAQLVQFRDVDPGTHTVVLRRGDTVVVEREITVGGGAPRRADVTIRLGPAEAAAPIEEEGPSDSDEGGLSLGPWWLWAGAGAAALATVAVVVLVGNRPDADPVGGDTDPPVVRGVVQGTMP